jgi:hypothetical protein
MSIKIFSLKQHFVLLAFGVMLFAFADKTLAQDVIAAPVIRASPPTPAPYVPKTTVRGQAVYEDTGRPVRRTSVMLVGATGGGQPHSALTDNNGFFEIKNVGEGKYYSVINAPGAVSFMAYMEFNPRMMNQPPPIEQQEEIERQFEPVVVGGGGEINVLLRARRGGAIGGRVTHADGDPAIGVRIEVLQKKDDKLSPILSNFNDVMGAISGGALGGGKTDDRGVYRISGLPAGEYIVRVTESASHTTSEKQNDFRDSFFAIFGGSLSSFVTTYYPDSTDSEKATPIKIELGQEMTDINIALPERAFHNVAGKVVARGTKQPVKDVSLQIQRKDDTATLSNIFVQESGFGGSRPNEQGEFAFKELPTGTYILKVKPPSYLDRMTEQDYNEDGQPKPKEQKPPQPKYAPVEKEITIADKDLNDLVIELPVGATIKGRFAPDAPNKSLPSFTMITAEDEKGERLDSANLSGYDYEDYEPGAAEKPKRAPGEFALERLPKGKIYFDASISTGQDANGKKLIYYPKAITFGGKDFLTVPFEIKEGETIEPVQIVLATDGGTLKGKIKENGADKPAASRRILLIPTDQTKWQARSWRLSATSNDKGEFSIEGAPVEYFIIFLTGKDKNPAMDDAWIRERTASAEKVTIKAGGETTVNLTAP